MGGPQAGVGGMPGVEARKDPEAQTKWGATQRTPVTSLSQAMLKLYRESFQLRAGNNKQKSWKAAW